MGFLKPFYLFGLFATSIPIIIHLLHRRRLKRVEFSSLFFLRDLRRERFSWLRLREILLLLLRTLIIFFLFFALARPYIRTSIPIGKGKTSVVIIIDDSYSMGYGDHFKKALKEAKVIIKNLPRGSEVAIFTTSPQRRDEIFSKDLEEVVESLDDLSVSYSAEDFQESYKKAFSLLSTASFLKKEIFLITDLQKRALSSIPSLRRKGVECRAIDVGDNKPENLGIVQVFTTELLPVSGRPTRIGVKVRNYSEKSSDIRLILNVGKIREEWRGRVGGFQTKTIQFEREFVDPGEYKGSVELLRDSLPQDNLRFFSFNISSAIPVLLLYNRPEDIFYIATALSPFTNSPFLIEKRGLSEFKGIDLSRFKVIGVINPEDFPPAGWLRLQEYSKNHGVFVSLLKPPRDWLFTMGRPLEVSSLSGFLSIKDIDDNHPIFSGSEKIELGTSHFFKVCKVIPEKGRVLALFSNNTPFLLEDSIYRIILATTSFIPEATDFIYKAAFVPLIHRIFLYLAKGNLRVNYRVGDTIEVPISQPYSIDITTPSGNFRVLPEIEGNRRVVRWKRTEVPGVYRIGKGYFTVNIESEEGNLERVSPSQLKEKGIKLLERGSAEAKDLSKTSLLLAVILLILEMVLIL